MRGGIGETSDACADMNARSSSLKMLEKSNNSILITDLQGKYCPCFTGGSNQRTDAEADCGLESFGLPHAYPQK
jgi:hypothetical protein